MMLGDNVEWKEPVECVLPEKPEWTPHIPEIHISATRLCNMIETVLNVRLTAAQRELVDRIVTTSDWNRTFGKTGSF